MKRSKMSKDRIKEIYTKYSGKCSYCGCDISLENFHIDHIKPLNRGVPQTINERKIKNNINNLTPSCKRCNSSKKNMPLEVWRESLWYGARERLRNDAKFMILLNMGSIVIIMTPVVFHFESLSNNYH